MQYVILNSKDTEQNEAHGSDTLIRIYPGIQELHFVCQVDLFAWITERRKQGWSSGRRCLGKKMKKMWGKGKGAETAAMKWIR